jgi:hypothetical protein
MAKDNAPSVTPYTTAPAKSFWKPAIAQRSLFDISELWDPKFQVQRNTRISTFGSCFAQHIGRALQARGFQWYDAEPLLDRVSDATARRFGYRTFSARTGNIYTTSLLRQWTEWALGDSTPPDEIWEQNGRFFDPFRPRIEPNGFASAQEVTQMRDVTIDAFRDCIESSDIFVFTLGLTESWFSRAGGYEYPVCPGAIAGDYDEEQHKFLAQPFEFIRENLMWTLRRMREANPRLRFLLTVSPVPLVATNTGQHVLVATMESKSILRAVAGQVARNNDFVDYFPSYEIINSPAFRGTFFEPNLREVNPHGVNLVMGHFFEGLHRKFGISIDAAPQPSAEDIQCEEAVLEAFGS